MIEGYAFRRVAEIGTQQQFGLIPSQTHSGGQHGVYVVEYQSVDAVLLEGDGRGDVGVLVKTEYAAEPAVVAFGAADDDVLGDIAVMLFLGQCEVAFGQEVLVEGHVVGKILKSRDGGEGERWCGPGDSQAVGESGAAVETRIVIVDAAGLG